MSRLFLQSLDFMNRIACWIVGVLFGVATIAVLVQVCVRFVLPKLGLAISAPWTEELARYLVTWCVFLGVGVLCRHARLIAVEILTIVLPFGKALKIAGVVVTIAFFVLLVQTGMEWISLSSIERSPVMRIPMTWVAAAMPVGSVLAILNLVGFVIASMADPTKEAAAATGLAEIAGD
jgi:TRAP-type C4-dicarboxylate transport system permease small subunit